MRKIRKGQPGMVSATAAALVCMLCLSLPAFAADPALEQLLPAQACADGWVMEDKPVVYTKDNLFDYINGEAELYFPYGFEALAAARYMSTKNPEVSLVMDVYKMGSLTDAFGMYANYRRSDDDSAKAGADAVLSPSQMLMYQDRYYVRLQASGATGIDEKVFLACAHALSKKLPQNLGQPKELDVFRNAALIPKSERYIAQSLLGYSFFQRGFMADATVNGTQAQVFMVPEESPVAARKAFDQYRAYLKESGKEALVSEAAESIALTATDPLYSGVAVRQSGRSIIGVIRLKNPSDATPLLDKLITGLPR
ncbi:MAG: hypothetical protein FD164_437 [Nitrospirae bacterium]|nr:MAG: hypothetical protein FD164_437 [Nitrospirota bacterium]